MTAAARATLVKVSGDPATWFAPGFRHDGHRDTIGGV
jgi:hypothetical protein